MAEAREDLIVLGEWLLTAERAAIHLPTSTAVVADLHLGYDDARRRAGDAVPSAGLDDVVAPLEALLYRYEPKRLVIAGDLLEDGRHIEPADGLLAWLRLHDLEEVAIVPGNHDRGLHDLALVMPIHVQGYRIGSWRVLHGEGRLPGGKIVLGHHHPSISWRKRFTLPCYLVRDDRLVLPAMSRDAAGADVMHSKEWDDYRAVAIAEDEVLDMGPVGDLRKAIRASR